jgi:co-chaperonin GroES (HSP10)
MLKPTDKDIQAAHEIVAKGNAKATGYRLIIKPLPWDAGLKAGEAEIAPELAKMGFVAKTETQSERESRGSHVGILCDIGESAFNENISPEGKPWANVGDIVVFNRYAGQRVDLPPGSDDFYQFCNDEDILGKYEVQS